MAKDFTDLSIKRLKPRAQRFDVREGDGFVLRVFPSGDKSFQFVYQRGGIKKRLTLGRYVVKGKVVMTLTDARKAHRKALLDLDEGRDPAEKKKAERVAMARAELDRRGALTVNAMADRYIEEHVKPRCRTWRNIERMLDHAIRPNIGRLKATEVTAEDVSAVIKPIMNRGKGAYANRVLSVVRAMFAWGVKETRVIKSNVARDVSRPAPLVRRDRVLSEPEIRALWTSLPSAPIGEFSKQSLRLALLTGQRIGEITGMQWDELDLEGDVWTIPRERSKNDETHSVPLCPMAKAIIEELQKTRKSERYVFPNRYGRSKPMPAATVPQVVLAWLRNKQSRPMIETTNGQQKPVDRFTPHDLRRTVATQFGALGVSRFDQDRVLNHADSSVSAIYDRHRYDKEKRDALMKWERRLAQIVCAGSGATVIAATFGKRA